MTGVPVSYSCRRCGCIWQEEQPTAMISLTSVQGNCPRCSFHETMHLEPIEEEAGDA